LKGLDFFVTFCSFPVSLAGWLAFYFLCVRDRTWGDILICCPVCEQEECVCSLT